MARFIGVHSWSDTSPCIEFNTDAGEIDLHNNARIERLVIIPAASTFALIFLYADDWRDLDVRGRLIEMEFGGIRDLNLKLASDYHPLAATSFEGITHQIISGRSYFELDMGDIQCSLTADSLTIR